MYRTHRCGVLLIRYQHKRTPETMDSITQFSAPMLTFYVSLIALFALHKNRKEDGIVSVSKVTDPIIFWTRPKPYGSSAFAFTKVNTRRYTCLRSLDPMR